MKSNKRACSIIQDWRVWSLHCKYKLLFCLQCNCPLYDIQVVDVSQRVEGRCYYNEMVREKFILIGKKGVLGVNLNPKWAPTLQGIATKKFKIKIFSIIFYHF